MSGVASVEVDGRTTRVERGMTIEKALEVGGYRIAKFPERNSLFVPCGVGGCWSCAVEVDGEVKPACSTQVADGMSIKTKLPEDHVTKRVVHGFAGHTVGGVGTPWWLKSTDGYIEVACFASGCNLRCPQCQNWQTTYMAQGSALTPKAAAVTMTAAREKFKVDRMAISGGESTLNRKWLVQYVKYLRALNTDSDARIHMDTNATILTGDYIDELVRAGVTDIGPDLKGYFPETFMKITGVEGKDLAEDYLSTSWDAVSYLAHTYKGKVFIGVGIPYNKELISVEEVVLMGERLYRIDPEIQVCVLDYRPEFKRPDLVKPSYDEMVEVHRTLRGKGLKTVICQTERGHIGPEV
jgi:pyruvate formate lyase activating enzyme